MLGLERALGVSEEGVHFPTYGSFPKGPQYRPQNIIVLSVGTSKRVL